MYNEVGKSLIHHLNDALKVYRDCGVVTSKDIEFMTSNAFLDKLSIFMSVTGYPKAVVQNFDLWNGNGFSGIMYNPEYYSTQSAENYLNEIIQN